ncbi:MAG TPA: acyltransferase, partial [Propionibacteriaceae bacterium]|nr:acyltransferase [Propionibacteriaceae bacterium]
NLKAVLVAWIIAGHAMLGYTAIGGWPYDEVSETTLPTQLELVLAALVGPTALFVIGTFFFLSGLFAPSNIARHGPAGFLRQRLVRLGLPWLMFTLLIWPVVMWLAYRSAGHPIPIWEAWQARQPFLDSGPLWFVQILLYVSLFHALLARRGHGREAELRTISLVLTAACIAATSFAVRLWFPARSQQILDLHVWQWPQCIGLYVLGVLVADKGWAEQIPPKTGRRCGMAVLGTIAVALAIMAATGVANPSRDDIPFLGGWHWQALAFDVAEASLVVAGSVWLLAVAQRWLTQQAVGITRWARAAYAAYLLQAPVLIGLEIAERALPWPAVIKGVTVAALAIAGSFALGRLLVRDESPSVTVG